MTIFEHGFDENYVSTIWNEEYHKIKKDCIKVTKIYELNSYENDSFLIDR